ncbi:MAG: gluconate:H+ symporter [Hyphomonas sp.]|uniref:GntP family permease n=1 Tax=Hyphomonas sp. TaxID=87 RepID=UPI0035282193
MSEVFAEYRPLMAAAAGIAALLFLILRVRMNAFAALLLVSLFSALAAGLSPDSSFSTITKGMGGTLGFIATVIGLGALFGAILNASGALESLAGWLTRSAGLGAARWQMAGLGVLASTPVFFDVALIILAPLIFAMAHRKAWPVLALGLPLAAGLAVGHAFLPPTPGPIAIAELIGADLGWVILFGAICGLFAISVAGPVLTTFLQRTGRLPAGHPTFVQETPPPDGTDAPARPGLAAGLILLPLVLILLGTLSKSAGDGMLKYILSAVGHPFSALLIGCGATWLFLTPRTEAAQHAMTKALKRAFEPTGAVILVTGAGGAFKQVLVDTGAGAQMAESALAIGFGPLVAGYVLAVLLRLAQGSATVAMITTGGLITPIIAGADVSAPQLGLITVAVAAGATTASHVNDSGFWLVGRIFGLTPGETIRTWTLSTTLISVCGFTAAMLLNFVLLAIR